MSESNHILAKCPLCGGSVKPGETTFTADIGSGVVVVRHVPASVCALCGESWLEDDTARNLEKTVERARAAKRQVEVLAYQQ